MGIEIKHTTVGFLVYSAMFFYLAGFVLSLLRNKKVGKYFYFFGFVFVLSGFICRWVSLGQLPLQRLFDVFLCMGMVYPVSVLCSRFLGVRFGGADMLIGVIVLFPVGFIFSSERIHFPPALQSWLFGPHVAVYLLAYIIMAKATVQAVLQLWGSRERASDGLVSYEEGTYKLVCVGFVPLTIGLFLGSYWGKYAWGEFWNWDPKEMWSLTTWLVYVIYFHFRYITGRRRERLNSLIVLVGQVCIISTLLWANIGRIFSGLHNYTG